MSLLHTSLTLATLTLVSESAFVVDIAGSAVAILSNSGYDQRVPRLTPIA
jgi:hypothetical protein